MSNITIQNDTTNVSTIGEEINVSVSESFPTSLNTLTDVSIDSPINAEALIYNSTSGKWENSTAGAGSGDVTGPGSATNENITVFDSTTGKIIKDSGTNISAVTANTAKTGITSQQSTDITTNNSKVTNATHTGDVTGDTGLTLDKTAVTGQSTVTAVGADFVLISDTNDTGNLKKALISDFASAGGDMAAAVYDPTTVNGDAFDMDNMTEGTTTKILTDTERTAISNIDSHISSSTAHGVSGTVVGTTDTQTLSNKNLIDLNTKFVDNLDNTKTAAFELVNLSTSTNIILTLQDKNIVIADNADVTAHTSASNIHFLQSAISIPASQVSDFDTEVSNNSSVSANTSKDTNVSTNLSAGTLTATTIAVNSSDGTNATLVEADTTNAGILGSDKWDEIVANSVHTAGDGSDHSDVATNNAKVSFTKTNVKGQITHGGTAGTARPSGFTSVEWQGTVEPSNAVNEDTWIDTT